MTPRRSHAPSSWPEQPGSQRVVAGKRRPDVVYPVRRARRGAPRLTEQQLRIDPQDAGQVTWTGSGRAPASAPGHG
jgi:hypothetical protein